MARLKRDNIEKRRSQKTAKLYVQRTEEFANWCQAQRRPFCPTNQATVEAYKQAGRDNNLTEITVKFYHTAINATMVANGFDRIPTPKSSQPPEPPTEAIPVPPKGKQPQVKLSEKLLELALEVQDLEDHCQDLENLLKISPQPEQPKTSTVENDPIANIYPYGIKLNWSPKATKSYVGKARAFVKWCHDTGIQPLDADLEVITSYRNTLREQGKAHLTIEHAVISVNHLLKANGRHPVNKRKADPTTGPIGI